jgi:hypothetical protein
MKVGDTAETIWIRQAAALRTELEVEYIGNEQIQRSLKRFPPESRSPEIWATRYGFVARDGLGEMEGRGTGKSRRKYTGTDEMRFAPLLPIYRRAESPEMQGRPKGFALIDC